MKIDSLRETKPCRYLAEDKQYAGQVVELEMLGKARERKKNTHQ
jgi:hypothetical protein